MKSIQSMPAIACTIFFGFLVVATIYPAFAQNNEGVTVLSEKSEYQTGDLVRLSGKVENMVSGQKLSIEVFGPNNTLTISDSVDLETDGSYSYEYTIDEEVNLPSGEYTMIVMYGAERASSSFMFTHLSGYEERPSIMVTIDGITYNLFYEINGARMTNMQADIDRKALVVTLIEVEDDGGSLLIWLPKSVIDAQGERFIVSSNKEADIGYEQMQDDQNWNILQIPLEADSRTITISGTYMIPELPLPIFIASAAMVISVMLLRSRTLTSKFFNA